MPPRCPKFSPHGGNDEHNHLLSIQTFADEVATLYGCALAEGHRWSSQGTLDVLVISRRGWNRNGMGWGGGVGCWFPIHALVSKSPPAGFRFEPRVSDSVFLWFPIRFPLVSDSVSTGFRFAGLVSDSFFSGFRFGVSDSVLNHKPPIGPL